MLNKKKFKYYLYKTESTCLLDFILVVSYFILFYLTYLWGVLAWVSLVPIFLLAKRNSFLKFIAFTSLAYFLVTLYFTWWIRNFSNDFFYIVFIYYFFASILSVLIPYYVFKSKIKFPFQIVVGSLAFILLTSIFSLIKGGGTFQALAVFQPMLYPLIYYLGETGITFLIIFVNFLITYFIFSKDKRALVYLAIIFVIIFSCFIYSYTAKPEGNKVRIALIQGNIQMDWDWRIKNATTEIFDIYQRLTLEAAKNKPDIIIWPEYAIPEDITVNRDIYEKISNLAKEANAYIVFGSLGKTEMTDPRYNYIKNIAQVFDKKGNYVGGYTSVSPFAYDKEKIIPGFDLPVFNTEFGKFSISACFEEDSGYIYKNYAKSGADFFIDIVNDAPLKDIRAMKRKAMLASLRAAANKKYLVRSTNTGFTQVTNPFGKVIAILEPNKEGILITDIFINSK